MEEYLQSYEKMLQEGSTQPRPLHTGKSTQSKATASTQFVFPPISPLKTWEWASWDFLICCLPREQQVSNAASISTDVQ